MVGASTPRRGDPPTHRHPGRGHVPDRHADRGKAPLITWLTNF